MPHTFGRAGMANIIIDDHSSFDFKNFFEYTTEKLPPYAVPLFLRCSKSLEVTGTLKYLKLKKQKEGFNPGLIEDPIYFRDKEGKTFAPLTPETYQNIINLTIKM
uniref:AMP-binding enzyme C-terminal domain-containing protein n=1 Tax=Arcella intermedia TaxID=1963864 RepID=A0A6B2LPB2_9EUKA|eukprot:TRINITY_DN939_c0_g1_i17.p3 TRINITY_DN939_c0_g1~~TRINITY_DN939_c0_g1_i17.p3  ORF type:complete len:105 (+),score=24.73 TRINITY_DN939_c0_g1_i17:1600-1914(+)